MIMMAVTFSVFALGTSDAETEDSALPEYRDTIRFASGSDQNYMDGQMNNTNDVMKVVNNTDKLHKPTLSTVFVDTTHGFNPLPE